jgi:hypothetical protein
MTVVSDKPVLAYSFAELASAAGCSVDMVQRAKRNGEFTASLIGSKRVVEVGEAQRWIKSLPKD